MNYLAVFEIKNKDFKVQDYGLIDYKFSIDITTSIQVSKGVKFTEYPLLEGTTRIDTVSRAPGSINFNGKIGDVVHTPTGAIYKVEDNKNQGKTRLSTFISLLEALRDQAIVLDVITYAGTDSDTKIYENYLIESLGFGISQFGVMDVNFSMKEFIAFGSEIELAPFDPTDFSEDNRNQFALYTLTMDNFRTEKGMIDSFYKLLTDPDISAPYMIKMGNSEAGFTPDITIPKINVIKPTFQFRKQDLGMGFKSYYRTYNPTRVSSSLFETIYSSGTVLNNLKLKITIPRINGGESLVKENSIIKNDLGAAFWDNNKSYEYKPDKFEETPKYKIKIELFENNILVKTQNPDDILITPRYSNIYGGVNTFAYTPNNFENDLILGQPNTDINKIALCFLRKTTNPNEYALLPNLLEDTSYGYLYAFTYLRDYVGTSDKAVYNLGFIYLHPKLVKRLEDIINTFTLTEGNLLYGKTIKWW